MTHGDARHTQRRRTFCPVGPGTQVGQNPCPESIGVPMNTRTIAILALVIAVVLVILLFLR